MENLPSLHIIGSKLLGGAERWLFRFTHALLSKGQTAEVVVRQGTEVAQNIDFNGICWKLPLRTVWDPLSKYEIAKLLKKRQPALVQTYMGRATRLTRIKPGKGPVHVARLGGYYKLDGYRHAHAWIGNTKGVCDYLLREGFPKDRVFHLPNFIDLPSPASLESLNRLKQQYQIINSHILLCLGRLVPVKGYEYLLRALAGLPRIIKGKPLCLIILGKGELEQQLRQMACSLNVDDRIIWAGWQYDPELFYQISDLVVIPSLEREALGNVILEAWSHARPVLCSQFRGALELTHHGVDAWQVPCRDSEALTQGIERILKDEDLKSQLAQNGYRRVLEEFNREKIIGQYLDVYRWLVR